MSDVTNKNMVSCPTCGEEIAKSAKVCPKCGAKFKKPWYKKWWVWVIIVLVAAGIGGSSSSSNKEDFSSSTAPMVSSAKNNITDTDGAEQSQPAIEENTDLNAPESDENMDTVLWEDNGIRVIYKGMDEDYMGVNIKVLIENNSSKNWTISVESLDINGFSVNSSLALYAEVNSGKKTNDSIEVLNSYLTDNGINGFEDITDMEITFKAFNSDTFDSVESQSIKLSF